MTAVHVTHVASTAAASDVVPPTDVLPRVDVHDSELALAGTVAEALVVVVAVSRGRFRPCLTLPAAVDGGTLLGRIEGRNGRADDVWVPESVTLCGLLAWDNEIVKRGQPVAWGQRGV